MTPKHRERRGSRGFKLTNGDLHLLAMATEGERATDGKAGAVRIAAVRAARRSPRAAGRRRTTFVMSPRREKLKEAKEEEKKKTPNVNVTAYFLIQRRHASSKPERLGVLSSVAGDCWNGERRETEVVMSG